MKILTYGTPESCERTTFFLHGFPGVRSRQNRVFAETFTEKTGCPSVLFLYEGLGVSEGTFSFEKCLRNILDGFSELIKGDDRPIDLVGHSWGGFLSLKLAEKFRSRIRKLVLLSPLLEFHKADLCGPSFEQTARENPQVDLGDTKKLATEFERIGLENPYRKLVGRVDPTTEVTILQAEEDMITPPTIVEDAIEYFRRRPNYSKVKTDHSFLIDREALVEQVIKILAD